MAIGPSAGACCYEVDEPVLSKLRDAFADWQEVIEERSSRKALLDLRELIRRQALSSGLEEHNIAAANACTMCHPNLSFLPSRGRGEEHHGQWHCVGPPKLILPPQFCTVPMFWVGERSGLGVRLSSVRPWGAIWGTNEWLLGSGRE